MFSLHLEALKMIDFPVSSSPPPLFLYFIFQVLREEKSDVFLFHAGMRINM